MYRFLLSTRWFGWFILVCILTTIFVSLGNWQLDRRNSVVAEIQKVENNYNASPVPLSSVPTIFESLPAEKKWTPVTLRGEYLTEKTTLVRNRPLNGTPGYEVLVPFKTEDGTIIVVDRGWLPIGNNTAGQPDTVPAPPSGTATVVVRAKEGEPSVPREAPAGQIASIELPKLAEQLSLPIETGAYGIVVSESPAVSNMPTALPKPETSEGTHLSYAAQWFAFGVLAFIALFYAARQQVRINREDREEAALAAELGEEAPVVHSAYRTRRKPTKVRRDGKLSDEEAEDQWVEENLSS